MSQLGNILSFNQQFVTEKKYEQYLTTKFPDKKLVIVTCMDTRLTELLPKALNLRNGDAKMIKSAGGIVTQPFGSIMRSILVALYELDAHEVLVIGHYECGMTGLNANSVVQKMLGNGIQESTFETLENAGINLNRWLIGFDNVHDSVERSVNVVRKHPLMPPNTPVHGLIIDPTTGKLDLVTDGNEYLAQHK